jgi:hypothetical protein
MKVKLVRIPVATAIIIALAFSSCKKEKEPVYNYLVSGEYVVTWPVASVNYLIDLAAQQYSAVTSLKPFVTGNANVYRLVYKTKAGDADIEASGLVCVPQTPGVYPVLSFQNGTNTLYDFAPSKYVTYPPYELVEIIASMGFIVVIPDYPGFGSSEDVPHPYLVKTPTVQSVTDMFRAVKEGAGNIFPGVLVKNEYYLMGYSQGGWATLALHKALELDNPDEFNLKASVCGAGPYNMYNVFLGIVNSTIYPMPSYICYIINAYSYYEEFSNPVTDILREPYASRLSGLYDGTRSLSEINSNLNDTINVLFSSGFLSGYSNSATYASMRQSLVNNSVSPWHTYKPIFFGHGGSDTQVNESSTENIYSGMIGEGTDASILKKTVYPGLDHGDALLPCVTDGLLYLLEQRSIGLN